MVDRVESTGTPEVKKRYIIDFLAGGNIAKITFNKEHFGFNGSLIQEEIEGALEELSVGFRIRSFMPTKLEILGSEIRIKTLMVVVDKISDELG